MLRELNSKMTIRETRDTWWFNISEPQSLSRTNIIRLNLWDADNNELVKQVTLDLSSDSWLEKIQKAPSHTYKGREILKANAYRDRRTNRFILYFGRVGAGLYRI